MAGQLAWPILELRDLRVFIAVAEELHFGRAADRLEMNRSRVSQVVATLEARLGGRVFERTSRVVRLTPLGERLLTQVAPVYRELDDVVRSLHVQTGKVSGTLLVGIYSSLSTGPYMQEIVRRFEARYPACQVAFTDLGYERSYVDVLREAAVEVLAVRIPLDASGVSVGPRLSREPRVLVVARDDPLAGRESISYEEIANRVVSDVPAFPREMMDAFIPPTTPSGKRLARMPNRTAEDTMMRVALGSQVHPTVASFLDHITHPGVTSVPIHDLPPSETALCWLTANRSTRLRAFLAVAEQLIGETELTASPSR